MRAGVFASSQFFISLRVVCKGNLNIVRGFGLCGAGGLAKEPHRCLKRAEWVAKTTRVHARVEESDIGGYRPMYWQLSTQHVCDC